MSNISNSAGPDFTAMRMAMVISQLRPNGVTDARLLMALNTVPRENFVPRERQAAAYADRAVPLMPGRALNPTMTTARLLDALKLAPADRLLIIGAASGYAAAVASGLCKDIVAVEQDDTLLSLLQNAGTGATIVAGSLFAGAPDHAPFDAILIDGAVETVPDALIGQLAPEGRLACGIASDGVTRLATGRRGGSSFALADFADAEVVILPGFAPAREFVF